MNSPYHNTIQGEQGKRILLVEDDEATRESASIKLRKEGFDVVSQEDGQVALDFLKKDPRFDAILLDLRMPRSDGFEFLEARNKIDTLKDIPVIVFSNLNQHEHIERAVALGVRGYLVKAHHSIQQIVVELKTCLLSGVCRIDK